MPGAVPKEEVEEEGAEEPAPRPAVVRKTPLKGGLGGGNPFAKLFTSPKEQSSPEHSESG